MTDSRTAKRLFNVITACRLVLFILLLIFLALEPSSSLTNCMGCHTLPALLGAAFFMTFVYLVWHKVRGFEPALLHLQTVCDVILAGVTVYITNGVASHFTFFFVIAILTASMLGGQKEGTFSAVASTLLYLAMFCISAIKTGDISQLIYTFGINLASFNLISAIGLYITGRLGRTEEELYRATADLELARRMQEYLAQSMNSGLLILDRDGIVVFANKAAERIIDVVGTVFEPPLPGRHVTELWQPHLEMIDKIMHGNTERQEFSIELEGGKVIYIGISGFTIHDNSAALLGFGLIFQDITENKLQDEKLRRMDRLAALGEMATGLAHEIRNPLASISGAAEFLLESGLSEESRRLVEIIKREGERLEDLTRSFLLYGKPRKKSISMIHVRSELESICELLTKRKKFTCVDVKISVPEELVVFMDQGLFTQALINVILNAFQAVSCEDGKIEIISEEDEDFVTLHVLDNGKGISPDQMDSIFNPFFTTKSEGTGLGLAIVYRIMNESGGSVHAESGPDGTIFSLAIPVHDR